MNSEDQKISLQPMAWIRSEFKQKFGTPRQGALARHSRAEIEIAPEWRGRGILSGLEGFSHVWIISFLHLSQQTRQRGKVHPPRLDGAKIGVFASRSPHRPNNLGLTLAKIEQVDGDKLTVSEVDLVHGTPILDLKPYLAEADRPESFRSGWTTQVRDRERACDFSEDALEQIKILSSQGEIEDSSRLMALIREMLSLDPRPPAYLDRQDAKFAVWIGKFNVGFRFRDERFTVESIEPI